MPFQILDLGNIGCIVWVLFPPVIFGKFSLACLLLVVKSTHMNVVAGIRMTISKLVF